MPVASANAQTGGNAFPLVVHCTLDGTDRFYYLSTIKPDGEAVYISPDNLAATITSTGAIRVETDGAGTCADKTLDQLKQGGQALFPIQQGTE